MIVLVVMVLGGLSALAKVATRPAAPPHPNVWAPEILPLATFIETTRGTPFKHPVFVEFLPDATFDAQVLPSGQAPQWSFLAPGEEAAWQCSRRGTDLGPCTDGALNDIDPESRTKRLMGLEDLATPTAITLGALRGGDIIGVYLSQEKKILVRGAYSSDKAPTLVHELNHAWQDQHFGLKALDTQQGSDRLMAAKAAFEGDSMRIENLYISSLPDSARDELDDAFAEESAEWKAAEQTAATLSGDETSFEAMRSGEIDFVSFPYDEGQTMIWTIHERKGEAGLAEVLKNPPLATDEVIHPDRYLDRIEAGRDTFGEKKRLRSGLGLKQAQMFHSSPKVLGEQINRLLLESVTSEEHAIDLSGSIRTDGYVVYWENGLLCVDVGWIIDSGAKGQQVHAALNNWVTSRRGTVTADLPGTPTSTLRARICE